MGTSVSMSSSPEPEEENRVERALRILQQSPVSLTQMLRLIRMIGEMGAEEKVQLLEGGVIKKIVLMIVERSGYVLDGGKNALQRRISRICETHCSNAGSSYGSGSVAQIGTGRRNCHGEDAKPQRRSKGKRRQSPNNHSKAAAALKGVGYGSGSTRSRWDVERAAEQLMANEEQLVWLMNCLTAYLWCQSPDIGDPVDTFKRQWNSSQPQVKAEVVELIGRSTIICSFDYHIKNESLFDVSERIEFYQALFELTCCLAIRPALADLLAGFYAQHSLPGRSIYALTARFCDMLSAYARPLNRSSAPSPTTRIVNGSTTMFSKSMAAASASPDFRLVDFALRIEKCCRLINVAVQAAVRRLSLSGSLPQVPSIDLCNFTAFSDPSHFPALVGDSPNLCHSQMMTIRPRRPISIADVPRRQSGSSEEVDDDSLDTEYVSVLKRLQISSRPFVGEFGKLTVPFSFAKEAKSLNPFSPSLKERTRRIARELASLQNTLPLSYSNSIFLCVDEARCDIMKALITGPDDTPYQNGLFEFDLFFPSTYPCSPPKVSFLTTANGEVRFNPNLYQDGKICLSILNTWEGRPEEKWSPFCSLLQVLISIQALIFVREPYFNEPGFEKYFGSEKGVSLSKAYNLQLQQATLRYAILEQLRNPPEHFREIIKRHCRIKKAALESQVAAWVQHASLADSQKTLNNGKCKKNNSKNLGGWDGVTGSSLAHLPMQNLTKVAENLKAELQDLVEKSGKAQ